MPSSWCKWNLKKLRTEPKFSTRFKSGIYSKSSESRCDGRKGDKSGQKGATLRKSPATVCAGNIYTAQ
jgi:hypothetical protein